jgi:DNA (cytosine-5)-methyltransferase 1
MVAYYNEIDPFCAEWLRRLIVAGHIAPGDVDERSITDVRPDDLHGYTQCHFFAGVGVWSAALRAEGWIDEREIWTGSCPCQPFSGAGQRKGHADERHLWPAFHRLIAERSPAVVVGEQVASRDGREWFCAVRADLEALGYACGAADLCAAGAGAVHIRQRLYWVADAKPQQHGSGTSRTRRWDELADGGPTRTVADAERRGRESGCVAGDGTQTNLVASDGSVGGWDWIICTDGKARPTQPGLFPLVDAWPAGNRVALLRAAGNSLEIGTARQFIKAVMG